MSGAEPLLTAGPDETESVAAGLASGLGPGDVVFLIGEVGTGKTTFVRAACRSLGIRAPVTSPSFTLAQRYEEGRIPVSHLDFQRLAGGDEDPSLFAGEVAPDRVTFVEWPGEAPAGTVWDPSFIVEIEHAGGDRRRVTVRAAGHL